MIKEHPDRRRWSVAAPFFVHGRERWLDDFIDDEGLIIRKSAALANEGPGWHGRRFRGTPLADWREIWQHARRAGKDGPDGVVAVFPQLAAMAGLQNYRRERRIVAWCFNVGARPGLPQRLVARHAFRNVDRFVVHASGEIPVLSEWFDIPPERIRFVLLQQATIDAVRDVEVGNPFIVAMGSANRDYATFFEAIDGTGIPVRMVAAPRVLEGLRLPGNVTVLPPMTLNQSRALTQAARFSVVPLIDTPTASGQVTVVEAMRMRRAVIATRTVGTRDYLQHYVTGLLVDPKDAASLRRAVVELWEDPILRDRLAAHAADFAETELSDEAAADALHRIIRELG